LQYKNNLKMAKKEIGLVNGGVCVKGKINFKFILDLLRKYFRDEIFRFRASRMRSEEAYWLNMPTIDEFGVAEIWKLQ